MKQSLFVVFMFVLGCVLGDVLQLQWQLHELSMLILYLLMFQVGISVGCSDNLKAILRNFRPKMLLLPLTSLGGTLLFSALISIVLTRWSVFDCMAVGSGMGYYSLSSILITQLKLPTLGQQMAAELGTIALPANICRETIALTCAPLFKKFFGPYAPITAAGVTSVDVFAHNRSHVWQRDDRRIIIPWHGDRYVRPLACSLPLSILREINCCFPAFLPPFILFKRFFCAIKHIDVHFTMNATNAAEGGELPMQQLDVRLELTIASYPNVVIAQFGWSVL